MPRGSGAGGRGRGRGRNRNDNKRGRDARMNNAAASNRIGRNAPNPFAGPPILPRKPPESLNGRGTAVLWYRNDLRVRDNEALHIANTAEYLMPIYAFDERHYGTEHTSPYGFQRTGPFRAHFIRQAVEDVRDTLITLGCDMLVRIERADALITEVVDRLIDAGYGPVTVVAQKEATYDEVRVEREVERAVGRLVEKHGADNVSPHVIYVWGATLHYPDDLPFNPSGKALPDQFTEYRKWVQSSDGPEVRPEFELPAKLTQYPFSLMLKSQIPSLGDDLGVEGAAIGEPNDWPFPDFRAVLPFVGGPSAADARVNEYIWDCAALPVYKSTRNSSGTRNYSSKLSPYLAMGCLSPRTLYWQIMEFERREATPDDTYWYIFELLWRDYFKWISVAVGTRLFALNGFTDWWQHGHNNVDWSTPPLSKKHRQLLDSWIEGKTGAPFVDASMRELAHTGFMSDRGRQNCASFLINDLGFPDWRAGAEYFECMLLDHDVASNWGNWATMANVGSRRRAYKMNVIKQSMEYDSDGWFIKGWCPELARVPPPFVHAPHTMNAEQRELYKSTNDDHDEYVKPVVRLPRVPTNVEPKVQTPFPPVPDFSALSMPDRFCDITTTES